MDVIAVAECHKHQLEFINSKARHPALVGGFGSGKSHAGLLRSFKLKSGFPEHKLGVYAPTYPLLEDIWYPKFEEYCTFYNLNYKLNKANHRMVIENFGSVIFRSMDKPEAIAGYEVADSIIDELDLLKTDKAKIVWNKIIARQRQRKPRRQINTCAVMTTPEGYGFVYNKWKKKPTKSYELIQASTYDNAKFLPPDYIESLRESYDDKLLKAYLMGQFVNLQSGQVYYSYNEEQVHVKTDLKFDPTLPVCLCVDFNVDPMIWLIVQHRGRYDIRIIKEIYKNNTNTWDMCDAVKAYVPQILGGRPTSLIIYGDAAGIHRDTRGSYTDYSIIDEQFSKHYTNIQYRVPKANPPVRDRLLCVNNILNKNGLRISESVKELPEDFLQIVYDLKGGIDKKDMARTHASDAFGYLAHYEFPIAHKRRYATVKQH